LEASVAAVDYFLNTKKMNPENIVIVSPDAGGVGRATMF